MGFSISPSPGPTTSVLKCERSLDKWRHLAACFRVRGSFLPSLGRRSFLGTVLILRERALQCVMKTPFTLETRQKGCLIRRRISSSSPLRPPPPAPLAYMHTGQGLWGTQCFYCGGECLNSHSRQDSKQTLLHVHAPTHEHDWSISGFYRHSWNQSSHKEFTVTEVASSRPRVVLQFRPLTHFLSCAWADSSANQLIESKRFKAKIRVQKYHRKDKETASL